MGFWYSPPAGSGTTTTLPGDSVELHDDLSAQINSITDTFTVTRGKYIAGSLDLTVAGVGGMSRNTHFFEVDPALGTFRMARVLIPTDAPLIAQYKY
jgi:hypothetical protein